MYLLLHWMGLDNASGPAYLFWSGIGSDITEFAILGTIIKLYWQHKCATCWRIAHHAVKGTPWKTCHKHATLRDHKELHRQHEIRFPRQHDLLNRKERQDELRNFS